MPYATFQFNRKNENIIITDARDDLLLIINGIINRDNGLPNNPDAFFDIKSYLQEFAGNSGITILETELGNYISTKVNANASVNIEKFKPANSLSAILRITITVGTQGNGNVVVLSSNQSGDGLKLEGITSF